MITRFNPTVTAQDLEQIPLPILQKIVFDVRRAEEIRRREKLCERIAEMLFSPRAQSRHYIQDDGDKRNHL